jgi:hypothetical protein
MTVLIEPTHPTTKVIKITDITGKTIFLECPSQEIHTKLVPNERTKVVREPLK